MRIEDPNEPGTPDTPPADAAAELSAAMDAGIEAAGAPVPEVPAEPAVAPVPGTAEALEAERVAAEAASKTGAEDVAGATKPEPDAAIEEEIAGLNLKGKANERFREMAAELKALAPLRAELEKAGIKDIAELPAIVKQAKDGADLFELVQGTGANAEQFDGTLNYLALVNKGDPDSLNQAFDALSGELATLAKIIGREVPGTHDPLAEHPDLVAEIEGGDITRARALEIVQARTRDRIAQVRTEQASRANDQQTSEQRAQAEGVTALREWEAAQVAADPTYIDKRADLSAKVAEIRREFPPNKWVAATKLAYAALAAQPKPTPPPTKPPPGPMRPGMAHQPLTPAVFDDPMDAMNAGIEAASG